MKPRSWIWGTNVVAHLVIFFDACILYPAPIRDLFMELALYDLYQPKWSERVHKEWIDNLLKNRSDLTRSRLENTKKLMNDAILDALVTGFDEIEKKLSLPDINDNHILAAAIISNAKLIATYNLKDFPQNILKEYDIEAIHPDDFLYYILQKHTKIFLLAIRACHKKLKTPPLSIDDYLLNLNEKHKLVKTSHFLLKNKNLLT
jgi:hypothetical protein